MRIMQDSNLLFKQLLKRPETKKLDFKSTQYRFDNDELKSLFVKDILCMANTPGEDGYIVLGVAISGNERLVKGVSHHIDSAILEELIASIIDEPIQFEYLPVEYDGKNCAILHIPQSKSLPHWPKKDFGKIKKRVFYIRRSSKNSEASKSEIRNMFLSTVHISDFAKNKPKTTKNIIDEFGYLDIDKRFDAMYLALKRTAATVPLKDYQLVERTGASQPSFMQFALLTSIGAKVITEYAIFLYPNNTKKEDILRSRSSLKNILDSFSQSANNQRGSNKRSNLNKVASRLRNAVIVHISYKSMYKRYPELWLGGFLLRNSWNESWGNIVKWRAHYPERILYEVFIDCVTSEMELLDRLSNMTSWISSHPLVDSA